MTTSLHTTVEMLSAGWFLMERKEVQAPRASFKKEECINDLRWSEMGRMRQRLNQNVQGVMFCSKSSPHFKLGSLYAVHHRLRYCIVAEFIFEPYVWTLLSILYLRWSCALGLTWMLWSFGRCHDNPNAWFFVFKKKEDVTLAAPKKG